MSMYVKRGHTSDLLQKNLTGKYKPIMDYATNPKNGLDVQFRGNYINIYYNGGNILRVKPNSLYFDEFYFYLTPQAKRKSHIVDGAKSGNDSDIAVITNLQSKRDELLGLLNKSAEAYFCKAKKVMDKWTEVLKDELEIDHAERRFQHQLSLANRRKEDSDFVVLDLEYAVSKLLTWNNTNSNPRFDIIAIDNETNQLVVVELKRGRNAWHGKSGVVDHERNFNNTIGNDTNNEFLFEMEGLLKQKQSCGFLEKDIKINTALPPKFVLAIAGDKDVQKDFVKEFGQKYVIYTLDDTEKKPKFRRL